MNGAETTALDGAKVNGLFTPFFGSWNWSRDSF